MFKLFRLTALLEGVSYIALFFNMLYFKTNDIETYKMLLKPLGMAHGFLFIGYILFAFIFREEKNWNKKDFFVINIASLLPFGTFYVDHRYLKK